MPDHIHVLVSAHRDKTPLDMAYCYKRLVTLFARKEGYRGWIWQRRIYDRGIRSEFSNNIELAARYILENPVRAQLANDWHEWPYSYLHSDIE
jgi:REP element-mobilizing transposase RayT